MRKRNLAPQDMPRLDRCTFRIGYLNENGVQSKMLELGDAIIHSRRGVLVVVTRDLARYKLKYIVVALG